MKIALIGLGDIARKAYLPILTSQPGLSLMLCTRDPKVLAQVASQYRIDQVASDYHEIPKWQPDAVMIHSATRVHPEITRWFLHQGIPCFVDKPLADNGPDCERLYDLADGKGVPLYIGFNRRHLPLVEQHLPGLQSGKPAPDLKALRWEKNRVNHAAPIREMLFDDFIHPLDSINLEARSDLDQVMVSAQFNQELLSRIDIQWQGKGCLYQASMNRMAGATRESIQVDLVNQGYRFDSFTQGIWQQDGQTRQLHLKDWTPMLASKGFAAMLDDWFEVVRTGEMPATMVNRNLASHWLAEHLCLEVEALLHQSLAGQ